MSRTAFVFPGQGSQYIGMGKDFYEEFAVCREVFDTASEASDLDIAKLCFEDLYADCGSSYFKGRGT